MEDHPTVIYVAGSVQEAYLLKNLLAEQGIRATVTNEMLDKGSGVDYVGWSTLARVVVDSKDAAAAREIALEHDRRGAEMAQSEVLDDERTVEGKLLPEAWPRCPGCGAPRITRCPICQTTGIDFPEADDQYVWGMGLDEPDSAKGGTSCATCGGCGGRAAAADVARPEEMQPADSEAAETAAAGEAVEEDTAPRRLVLTCPTCDEPFLPEFPRRCTWCNHQFDDGYEPDDIVGPLPVSNRRVVAVALGLFLLLAAVAAYFMFLM